MNNNIAVIILILLLTAACTPSAETTKAEEDNAAASPEPAEAPATSNEPEIFGRGTLSTEAPEFATSLTADGNTVYFNRTNADRSELAIMTARLVDGTWTDIRTVPFSGTYRDVDPFVTADGQRIFYSSNRPGPGESEAGDFDLWYVDKDADDSWSEPQNITAVNTDATEIYSTVAANGNLYFASDRDGGEETFIYRSRFVDGTFAEPERLTLGTEEESAAGNPAIAPDESFLVVVAVREDGVGGADLYVSHQKDGAWTSPVLMQPPVSSEAADFAPVVGWGNDVLYFTSERPGVVPAGAAEGRPPGDLYVWVWADRR